MKNSSCLSFHIRLLSLDRLPVITAKPQLITGMVDIEIAGVRKRFEINYPD